MILFSLNLQRAVHLLRSMLGPTMKEKLRLLNFSVTLMGLFRFSAE